MSPGAAYWSDRYERQGHTYVAKAGRPDSYQAQLKAITPHLDHLPSSGKVFDFGCGPGRFRKPLEDLGLTYVGVDLVPGLGTHEVDEIEPGTFTAAVAIFVLQHITEAHAYRDAVDLLHGALEPGGKLLVVDHYIADGMADHMHPRGVGAIWEGWDWSAFQLLGTYQDHWIGLFT